MPLVNEHTNCTENKRNVSSVTGAGTGASGASTGSDCVTLPLTLLERLFDDASRHSLPYRLRELEERFHLCPTGVVDVHNLVGLCASFGLHETLAKLKMFRVAPSEAGIVELWALLDTKRQRLQVGEPVSPISSPVSICDTRSRIDDTCIRPSTREFACPVPRESGLGVVAGASRLVRYQESGESRVCVSPTRVSHIGPIAISPFFDSRASVGIDDDTFIRDRHAHVFAKLGATASTSLGAQANAFKSRVFDGNTRYPLVPSCIHAHNQ